MGQCASRPLTSGPETRGPHDAVLGKALHPGHGQQGYQTTSDLLRLTSAQVEEGSAKRSLWLAKQHESSSQKFGNIEMVAVSGAALLSLELSSPEAYDRYMHSLVDQDEGLRDELNNLLLSRDHQTTLSTTIVMARAPAELLPGPTSDPLNVPGPLHMLALTPCYWTPSSTPEQASVPAILVEHIPTTTANQKPAALPSTVAAPAVASAKAFTGGLRLLLAAADAGPVLMTVIRAEGHQVLYQNSGSTAYAGCRTTSMASWQQQDTFLQQLLSLQPPELLDEVLETVVMGQGSWTRVLQVPASRAGVPPAGLAGLSQGSRRFASTGNTSIRAADLHMDLVPAEPSTGKQTIVNVPASFSTRVARAASDGKLQAGVDPPPSFASSPSNIIPARPLGTFASSVDNDSESSLVTAPANVQLPLPPKFRRALKRSSSSWLAQAMETNDGVQSFSGKPSNHSVGSQGQIPAGKGPLRHASDLASDRRSTDTETDSNCGLPTGWPAPVIAANPDRTAEPTTKWPIAKAIPGRTLSSKQSSFRRAATLSEAQEPVPTRQRLVQLLNTGLQSSQMITFNGDNDKALNSVAWSTVHDEFSTAANVQPDTKSIEAPGSSEPTPVKVDGACWHEVTVNTFTDPETGDKVRASALQLRKVFLVAQTDVTERSLMEQRLMQMTEAQLYMLENMFPRHILERIARAATGGADMHRQPSGQAMETNMMALTKELSQAATHHDCVTIMFTDIVGFTTMSESVQPEQVMAFLNQLFSCFDELVTKHKVSKVETAGDCFIVCAGLLEEDEQGFHTLAVEGQSVSHTRAARRVLNFAAEMMYVASAFKMPNGQPVKQRVGVHSGPVAAGLIGQLMPKFSLFGDTMNTASRMESTSIPGRIQVSEPTYDLLRDAPGNWECTGGVEIKGKGTMVTYLLSEVAMRGSHEEERGSHGNTTGMDKLLETMRQSYGPEATSDPMDVYGQTPTINPLLMTSFMLLNCDFQPSYNSAHSSTSHNHSAVPSLFGDTMTSMSAVPVSPKRLQNAGRYRGYSIDLQRGNSGDGQHGGAGHATYDLHPDLPRGVVDRSPRSGVSSRSPFTALKDRMVSRIGQISQNGRNKYSRYATQPLNSLPIRESDPAPT